MCAHTHIQRLQLVNQMNAARFNTGTKGGDGSVLDGGGSTLSSSGKSPSASVLMSAPMTPSAGLQRAGSEPSLLSIPASNGPPVATGTMGSFAGRTATGHTYQGNSTMGTRTFSKSNISGMGPRSYSRNSLASMSRSLGASKASLASHKSGRSSIQQEYHDKKVHHKLNAPWFGQGRKPFTISIAMFAVAFVLIVIGSAITILRAWGNLFLSLDKGDIIGPLIIASSVIFIALGIKFMYDAYTVGDKERRKIKFRAISTSMVSINIAAAESQPRPGHHTEKLASGTTTDSAITRAPIGSRTSLNQFM